MSDNGNQAASENTETTNGQNQGSTGETNGIVLTGKEGNTNTENKGNTDTTTAQVKDWKDGLNLPDDIKKSKSLASIKSVEDIVKGYVNAQGVIGKRFEDLTPEQMNLYYNKMGRPEDASKYELEVPEGSSDDLVGWFKKVAHDAGLPNDMAKKIFGSYNSLTQDIEKKSIALIKINQENEIKQLKQDFGPAFDERVEFANKAIRELGGKELADAIQQAGLGTNPTLVKALAKAGMMLSEGKFVEGKTTGKFGMTSEEATGQIEGLRKDPEFMKHYNNPSSTKHQEAKTKMENLYKIKVNAKS